jgi:hypothetical protein
VAGVYSGLSQWFRAHTVWPAHTWDMGRKIGTILGVILAIWVAFMALGWILAMVKTFLIIGLIAVVFVIVSLVAGRARDG